MISVLSLCLAVSRVVSVFIFLFAPSLSVVAYLVSVLLSTVVLLLVFVLVRVAALAPVLVRTFLFRGRFFSLSVFLYVGIFRVTAATAVFAITTTTTTAITAASTAAAAAAITVIAQVFATGCFLLF